MLAAVVLPRAVDDGATFVVLAVLASAAALVPIRFVRNEGIQGFTLEGGVLVAMLFSGPVGLAPLVYVLASVLAHAVRSRDLAKSAFNAGRTGLETTVGAVVFWLIAPAVPTPTDARSLLAIVLAAIAYEVTSTVVMSELFHRMSGATRQEAFTDVARLSGITFSVNTAYGLVLATVAQVSPWVTALSGLLMVGLYVGFRGYAAAVVDRRRAQTLNDVTHLLLDLPMGDDPLTAVLSKLLEVFGADRGELLVKLPSGWWQWTIQDGELTCTEEADLPRTGPMASAVARNVGRLEAQVTADGRPEDVLSAPVGRHGEASGAIVLGGRRGIEPWDDADATLVSAVANELAVALDNVRLLEQVEEERARLEAESTKLNDILTAATDGIVSVRADGTIEAWNPGMARITGVEPDVAVGQSWHAVLRLKDAEGVELAPTGDHVVSQAIAGEHAGAALSLQALRADGVWRRLQCTSSPIRDPEGAGRGVVLVARDVTTERELEELKSDFIATVSHELRTPLTPLKGFLSTLRTARAGLTDEQHAAIHDAMGKQLVRLETLISDLLAVAELDHGRFDLQPEPLALSELVADAVHVEAGDELLRCSLLVQPEVTAVADSVALVRIVRSLVANALKHTAGGVEIVVQALEDHVEVMVRDEGPGIASWDQQRVFNRFERLGNHLTRTQGPGLGLTIARSLARRMGGDVVLESDVGVGATFTLRLPRARPRSVPLRAVTGA